jgi:IS30 family transposase
MKKVQITPEQRYTISAMRRQGCSQKLIAATIGKDKCIEPRIEAQRQFQNRQILLRVCAEYGVLA